MKRKTTEEFIAAARNIFNEYDYSKTEYTGARNKVTITCRIHGDFIKAPGNLIDRKSGCPKCGNKRKGEFSKSSTAEFEPAVESFTSSLVARIDVNHSNP